MVNKEASSKVVALQTQFTNNKSPIVHSTNTMYFRRKKEAEDLRARLEKEKKELQDYIDQDNAELRAKLEAESQAMKEQLEKEGQAVKDQLLRVNNFSQA